MRTRSLVVAITSAAVLASSPVLAACGRSEPAAPPPAPAPPPAAQPAPAVPPPPDSSSVELDQSPGINKIKSRGQLMVGLPSDDPELATHDEQGGHSGFDVEIGRALATELGLNPQQVVFRWLPPSVRQQAMSSGSVDVQLGGFDPAGSGAATVGPYVLLGQPGKQHPEFIGFKPGDEKMREQLQQALDRTVADGSWQRACDGTLGKAGIPARPH
jgi:ABC-type amino acid transport substrate-binding protein